VANPYTDPPLIGIEATETQQELITDAVSGESVLAGEVGTRVVVDALGGRTVIGAKRHVRNEEGRIVTDPAATYACRCGKRLLTKESVSFCETCQIPACRTHLTTADDGLTQMRVCGPCFERGKWQRAILRTLRRAMRFLSWLTRI
jgi:hypothetical protein